MTGKKCTAELKQGEICSPEVRLRETTTHSIPLPIGTLHMKVFETACTHVLSCHTTVSVSFCIVFLHFYDVVLRKRG